MKTKCSETFYRVECKISSKFQANFVTSNLLLCLQFCVLHTMLNSECTILHEHYNCGFNHLPRCFVPIVIPGIKFKIKLKMISTQKNQVHPSSVTDEQQVEGKKYLDGENAEVDSKSQADEEAVIGTLVKKNSI